jgi:ABC-type amino acid transport substrate-binding protein
MLVDEAIKSGALKDTGASIVEYDTGAVAYTALKAGKIDFVVIDELPAKKLVGSK